MTSPFTPLSSSIYFEDLFYVYFIYFPKQLSIIMVDNFERKEEIYYISNKISKDRKHKAE